MEMLNKSLVGLTFGESPELNLTPADLLEDMVTLTLNGDGFNRINSVFGQTLSPEFWTECNLDIQLNATSPKAEVWKRRLLENARVYGVAIFITDANQKFTIKDMTIGVSNIPSNGKSGAVSCTLKGTIAINTKLIVGV